jgi:hypothetical protein
MAISYYLLQNNVATNPDTYYGKVSPNRTLDLEDVIKEMMKLGTGSSESDMRAIIQILFRVVADEVAEGNHVNLPLANFKPGMTGQFTSLTDSFDWNRHALKVNISPGLLMNQRLSAMVTEKISQPVPSPKVLEFTDADTAAMNSAVTSGGIGTIIGEELKFNPDNAEEGVFFVNGTTTKANVFVNRTDGKLVFRIPTLAPGTYTLEVRKGYTASGEIRKGELKKKLVVS